MSVFGKLKRLNNCLGFLWNIDSRPLLPPGTPKPVTVCIPAVKGEDVCIQPTLPTVCFNLMQCKPCVNDKASDGCVVKGWLYLHGYFINGCKMLIGKQCQSLCIFCTVYLSEHLKNTMYERVHMYMCHGMCLWALEDSLWGFDSLCPLWNPGPELGSSSLQS